MTYVHMLDDPWAPHPVVNRHICYGGGGGGEEFHPGQAPSTPDYTKYIEAMTQIGNKLTGYGDELYKWAKDQGIQVADIAKTVSGRAGELADAGKQTYQQAMAKWKSTYEPLYDAQAAEATRLVKDLPGTQEQYAGKYQADVAQAFDASREASERQLKSYGLKAPGSGSQRLDNMVSNQRGLAQVAAGEQGRMAARDEAMKRTSEAIQAGLAFPQVGGQGANLALSAGNQQVGAPESAISTTVGAYAPSTAQYNSAYPWMKQWGDTMATEYNQRLGGYNAYNNAMLQATKMNNEAAESGDSGIGGMLGGLAGTVAGSFMGPMGGAIGGKLGSMAGSMIGEKGGRVPRLANGGVTDVEDLNAEGGDQVVTPDMSQSQGAITDDVPARLNVGEFVLPKRFVEWKGEEWIQKEIAKADKARESQTIAEPDVAPMTAFDTQAPQFQSPQMEAAL